MRGTVSKIFDNGKRISFYMQGVDGSISTFDRGFAIVKEGDSIEYETVQKGQYTNLAHGWKVQATAGEGNESVATTNGNGEERVSKDGATLGRRWGHFDDAILAQVAFKGAIEVVKAHLRIVGDDSKITKEATIKEVKELTSEFLTILTDVIHGPQHKEIEQISKVEEGTYEIEEKAEITMADALIDYLKGCADDLDAQPVIDIAKEVGLVKRTRTMDGLYEKIDGLDFNDQGVMDKVAELKKKLTEMRI